MTPNREDRPPRSKEIHTTALYFKPILNGNDNLLILSIFTGPMAHAIEVLIILAMRYNGFFSNERA